MNTAPRLLALALMTCGVSACGFSPLYAPSATSNAPAIGPILIDEIPGKAGHSLKTQLDLLLGIERGTAAPRRLQIRLREEVSNLALRRDESATRTDLTLIADYIVYEPDGSESFRGASRATASYDIPRSAYGEIAAQDDARERAAEVLAERIRADLALTLAKR